MGAGASAPETLHKTLEETSETDLAKALHDLPAETRAKLREAIATGKAETGATGQEATNISTPRGSAEQKQLLADPGTPPTVTVTTEELAEAIDTVISLGMQMDREMKTNEEDQNAPGEAGRFAQYRTPRLRRKSRDLSEKVNDLHVDCLHASRLHASPRRFHASPRAPIASRLSHARHMRSNDPRPK